MGTTHVRPERSRGGGTANVGVALTVEGGAGRKGGVVDPSVLRDAQGRRRVQVELGFAPAAVADARALVRAVGVDVAPDLVADAELLTSELVSNAVRHGAPPLSLTVVGTEERLTIEVDDGSEVLPRFPARDADHDAGGGRGLRIVQLLANTWGTGTRPGGKTVWFRLEGAPSHPSPSKTTIRRRDINGPDDHARRLDTEAGRLH